MTRSLLRFILIVIAAMICAVAPACNRSDPPHAKPTIVVTIHPLADLVRQLVGDHAEVVTLVPAGASPHGFEPTPRQLGALARAKLLVMVGLGFDEWAAGSIKRHHEGHYRILRFGAAVGFDDDPHPHNHHAHDHDHAHHDHGDVNPHIWLDPVLAEKLIDPLVENLHQSVLDIEGLDARAEQLKHELRDLDQAYRTRLAPFRDRKIITYHNAFNPLAERYGLVVAATLTPIDSPAAVTKKRIDQAIAVVREHGVGAIFTEPQFPSEAVNAITGEVDIQVLELDPVGNPHDPTRNTYDKLMRYNLDTLVQGLSRGRSADSQE